jgi:hypothetical protein
LWTGPGRRGVLPGPVGRQHVFADGDGSGGPTSGSNGSGGQTSGGKLTAKQADSVANLKTPSANIVKQLSDATAKVMKENQAYETANKTKDEQLRLKKQKVVRDIVQAYGVGLNYVTGKLQGLESDNRDSPHDADTSGTYIIAYDGCLWVPETKEIKYPGYCASVILHESSHAQRNAELAKASVDSNQLGYKDGAIWSALKEYEGVQLEIDNATTTGLTPTDKKFAEKLRAGHLDDIENLMGKQARADIEKGGLDVVRDTFIQKLQANPKYRLQP